jgi:hypothetical protein
VPPPPSGTVFSSSQPCLHGSSGPQSPAWSRSSNRNQSSIWGEPVNFFPISGLNGLFLIVSVGHCKFRLSEESIGFILQATLGGVAVDFRPTQISGRVFKFVVASRNVGFHIYNLRSFSCDQYNIFFNLWGNGGAHWQSEANRYFREEESQWITVLSRKDQRNRSYADVVNQQKPVSGANAIPLGSNQDRRHHMLHVVQSFSRFPGLSIIKLTSGSIRGIIQGNFGTGKCSRRTWIIRAIGREEIFVIQIWVHIIIIPVILEVLVDKLILLFLCLRLRSVGRGAKLFQIQISKTREKPQCSMRTVQNYGHVFNVLP